MYNHTHDSRPLKTKNRVAKRRKRKHVARGDPSRQVAKAQAIRIPFPGFWPDGKLRGGDSANRRKAAQEICSIIDIVMALDRTGLYSAFFQYFPYIGVLEIKIYEGRWNWAKHPIWKANIDCRAYPLTNYDTSEPFYAQLFLEWLILLVQ